MTQLVDARRRFENQGGVIALPLMCLKDITALRFSAFLSMASIMYESSSGLARMRQQLLLHAFVSKRSQKEA